MKKVSSHSLADVAAEKRLKDINSPLDQINALLDWEALRAIVYRYYEYGKQPNGRRAYDGLLLLKMQLLAIFYNLSDREIELKVKTDLLYMRFVGLGLEDEVPDHTRIWNFRKAMSERGAYDLLLAEVNRQLKARGVIVEQGTIVDAKITPSAARPRKTENNTVDPEAAYTCKHGRVHYGYKAHVASDAEGMVLAVVSTPANESDMNQLLPVLQQVQQPLGKVYADKGYDSAVNRKHVERLGGEDGIKTRAKPKQEQSEAERERNRAIEAVRYKIERTFGGFARWFKSKRSPYLGLCKTHGWHVLLCLCHNLWRTPRLLAQLA